MWAIYEAVGRVGTGGQDRTEQEIPDAMSAVMCEYLVQDREWRVVDNHGAVCVVIAEIVPAGNKWPLHRVPVQREYPLIYVCQKVAI